MATTTDDALAASKRLRRTDCTCLGRGTSSVRGTICDCLLSSFFQTSSHWLCNVRQSLHRHDNMTFSMLSG